MLIINYILILILIKQGINMNNLTNNNKQFGQRFHFASSFIERVEGKIDQAVDILLDSGKKAEEKCKEHAKKIEEFIVKNKKIILFVGCVTASAFFAPTAFFSTAVATVIFRVELSQFCRKMAFKYLKEEQNPYIKQPKHGPDYISSIEFKMGIIAGVDALALGTIFVGGHVGICFIMGLSGVAAGSCIAKYAMDKIHDWKPFYLNQPTVV